MSGVGSFYFDLFVHHPVSELEAENRRLQASSSSDAIFWASWSSTVRGEYKGGPADSDPSDLVPLGVTTGGALYAGHCQDFGTSRGGRVGPAKRTSGSLTKYV